VADALRPLRPRAQNAEDNEYAPGVAPALRFLLAAVDPTDATNKEGAMYVFNNERGFQEKHVRAVCNVGSSTKKGKAAQGYIGEKGIGFKARLGLAVIITWRWLVLA
jgi:hypothetical protein